MSVSAPLVKVETLAHDSACLCFRNEELDKQGADEEPDGEEEIHAPVPAGNHPRNDKRDE